MFDTRSVMTFLQVKGYVDSNLSFQTELFLTKYGEYPMETVFGLNFYAIWSKFEIFFKLLTFFLYKKGFFSVINTVMNPKGILDGKVWEIFLLKLLGVFA